IRTDGNQGDLMLTLHAAVAQSEAQAFSENVSWAKRKSILNGTFRHSGPMPYGYTKAEGGSWRIHPDRAAVVQRVYQAFLQGKSTYLIAKELTQAHIPTAKGLEDWGPSIVDRILGNVAYTGDYLYPEFPAVL
ncbi:recombinase family protein, partial [Bacteroides sp.]|uniref:recombinase family protein n=1 Tax=Bacteroides sp. TaxID=29523 RepID=UPI002638A854